MKITLTLSQEQAQVLSNATLIEQPLFNTREQRVIYSLMREIGVKITRFYMSFTSKKKRKISFKLYEADLLERYLRYALTIFSYSPYERTTILDIAYEINQQLV